MQIFCIIYVENSEQRKDIGLDARNQDFQRADTDHQQEAGQTNHPAPQRASIGAVNHEAGQHFEQHMARHHRDKQSQREAERAQDEREQFDHEDQRHHQQRRAVRHEQAKKVQPVLPETNHQHDRNRDQSKHPGDGEMAGEGKRMQPDHAQRQQAEDIGKQDEHEQREDIGHIFAPGIADVGLKHVVDEAGEKLHRHLPAPRHQLTLHPAKHKAEQYDRGDQHPRRTVGEGNVESGQVQLSQWLDGELIHRINFGRFGCHSG